MGGFPGNEPLARKKDEKMKKKGTIAVDRALRTFEAGLSSLHALVSRFSTVAGRPRRRRRRRPLRTLRPDPGRGHVRRCRRCRLRLPFAVFFWLVVGPRWIPGVYVSQRERGWHRSGCWVWVWVWEPSGVREGALL